MKMNSELIFVPALAFLAFHLIVMDKELPRVTKEIHGQAIAIDPITLQIDEVKIRLNGVRVKEKPTTCSHLTKDECTHHLTKKLQSIMNKRVTKCKVVHTDTNGLNYGSCKAPSQIAKKLSQDDHIEVFGPPVAMFHADFLDFESQTFALNSF